MAIKEQETFSELSTRFGIYPQMISIWKREFLSRSPEIFSTKAPDEEAEKREKALYEKVGRLEVEVDFCKRASEKLKMDILEDIADTRHKTIPDALSRVCVQKQLVRELLTSEKELIHRSKRPIEPEAVFGQIKYYCDFKRFMLKTLPKVSIEFGYVALAHNLLKKPGCLKKEKRETKNLFLVTLVFHNVLLIINYSTKAWR
jgi:hypothetical protein